MPKFLWPLLIGGAATYFVYKSSRVYAWIAAAVTLFFTYKAFRG